jgi:hypothetical protein
LKDLLQARIQLGDALQLTTKPIPGRARLVHLSLSAEPVNKSGFAAASYEYYGYEVIQGSAAL